MTGTTTTGPMRGARWEAEMARFMVVLDGRPDQAATPLREIFNLHDQLSAAAASESSDHESNAPS